MFNCRDSIALSSRFRENDNASGTALVLLNVFAKTEIPFPNYSPFFSPIKIR